MRNHSHWLLIGLLLGILVYSGELLAHPKPHGRPALTDSARALAQPTDARMIPMYTRTDSQ